MSLFMLKNWGYVYICYNKKQSIIAITIREIEEVKGINYFL